jgi:hypothetical protein
VMSKRTLLIFFLAILLFVVPCAFMAGERAECRNERSFLAKGVPSPNDLPSFDVHTMWDFGMYDWMRYCLLGGIAALVFAALLHSRNRKQTR